MNQLKTGCVEFLDLTGIEDEQERVWIVTSLQAWNPNIQLPWTSAGKTAKLTAHDYNLGCVKGKHLSYTNGHDERQDDDEVQPNDNGNNKSWASLFAGERTAEVAPALKPNAVQPNDSKPPPLVIKLKEPFKSNADNPNLHRMGEFLVSYSVDNHIISLQPRGLINRSNYCYINSILQAIIACPPFYNLLAGLRDSVSIGYDKKRITPTIDGLAKFIGEFDRMPAGLRLGRRLDKTQKKEYAAVSVDADNPFEPDWMHTLMSGVRANTFEGRQEDAEEFLGCLLNRLNDEMVELMKVAGGYGNDEDVAENSDADKDWQVMGSKNKGAITRRAAFRHTPISDIFGGLLRSRIQRAGDKFTDNIQPFFTLQLHVEKVANVRDALELLSTKNQLHGVTSSKTNQEVEAWEQVTLHELPVVLILHLKCFDYNLDGCSKIMKAVEFPIDLKIDSKLLSSKANYAAKERQYKLFAIVYHEGKEASKGHYVTDAYHVGYASWLRYDDSSVKAVPEENVLNPQGNRVPYLLFYRRGDSLKK